jgi:hypothetical protein
VFASWTRLIRSLALMTLIKNLGRHIYPLKKNLVPRFDNKTRAIPSIMTRFLKGERHLRLHFPISGIQMEPKVHGAFPTTSSSFMTKQAMNVHMKS